MGGVAGLGGGPIREWAFLGVPYKGWFGGEGVHIWGGAFGGGPILGAWEGVFILGFPFWGGAHIGGFGGGLHFGVPHLGGPI